MQELMALIEQYGVLIYVLLFVYCAMKSGILPLFAGYAAQVGALDIVIVASATLAGGFLGDEIRFWVARNYGIGFLEKKPRLRKIADHATRMLERYGTAYIFIYRYPKGLRTVGALPVGLTSLSRSKFTVLNFASAALWTNILIGGGYAFGNLIEQSIAGTWAVFSLLALMVFIGIVFFILKKSREVQDAKMV